MPTTAQAMLQFYMDAEEKILKGQSVRMGERTLTLADLAEVRAGRREWQAAVKSEVTAAQGQSSLYAVADFSGHGSNRCEGFRR
jgi:hypothetical protein